MFTMLALRSLRATGAGDMERFSVRGCACWRRWGEGDMDSLFRKSVMSSLAKAVDTDRVVMCCLGPHLMDDVSAGGIVRRAAVEHVG